MRYVFISSIDTIILLKKKNDKRNRDTPATLVISQVLGFSPRKISFFFSMGPNSSTPLDQNTHIITDFVYIVKSGGWVEK